MQVFLQTDLQCQIFQLKLMQAVLVLLDRTILSLAKFCRPLKFVLIQSQEQFEMFFLSRFQ